MRDGSSGRSWNSVLCLIVFGAGLLIFVAPVGAQSWEPVWSDEFDYTGAPDTTKWSYDVGLNNGWGNNELQYYTEARPENVRVENGVLTIETRKEDFGGAGYTSTRLVTRDKAEWLYGRFEIRAKLPSGRGTWPAIWLLYSEIVYGEVELGEIRAGWPSNGEIDIMEHVGFDQDRIHSTIHVENFNGDNGTQKGGSKLVPGVSTDYHIYAVDWSPGQLDFSIDGLPFYRYVNEYNGWESWPYDQNFFMILNIAIGGDWGGAQGIDDTIFPQTMDVDYVRVYRYTDQPVALLQEPSDSLSLSAGESLQLSATGSDNDGVIERLVIRQGDGVLGETGSDSLSISIDDLEPGCYKVRATAQDKLGWISSSEEIPVTVGGSCVQAPYLMKRYSIPGRIEAEYFDLGGQNVGYFDLDASNFGNTIRKGEGVDILETSDSESEYYVGFIANREWLEYSVDVEESGQYTLDLRVSSSVNGGMIDVSFDGVDKATDISFGGTGSDQVWTTVSVQDINLDAGKQKMRVSFAGSAFNVNHLEFTKATGTAVDDPGLEYNFNLDQNYPNPVTGITNISYSLKRPAYVSLDLYDRTGKLVMEILSGYKPSGSQEIDLDTSNLSSGVYFYRMVSGGASITRSLTVM